MQHYTAKNPQPAVPRRLGRMPNLAGGLCIEVGGEWFFPEKGQDISIAQFLCRRCPVYDDCLEAALYGPPSTYGVMAGLSVRERQTLRKRLNQQGA